MHVSRKPQDDGYTLMPSPEKIIPKMNNSDLSLTFESSSVTPKRKKSPREVRSHKPTHFPLDIAIKSDTFYNNTLSFENWCNWWFWSGKPEFLWGRRETWLHQCTINMFQKPNQTKPRPKWKDEPSAKDREEGWERLQKLKDRNSYLRNPRFLPLNAQQGGTSLVRPRTKTGKTEHLRKGTEEQRYLGCAEWKGPRHHFTKTFCHRAADIKRQDINIVGQNCCSRYTLWVKMLCAKLVVTHYICLITI